MECSESSPARLLVVEASQALREALLSLLVEEGYDTRGVGSLEEALTEIEQQSYALILADLFAGVSRHVFTPAHILRRCAQIAPPGLITAQELALERQPLAGLAVAIPRPLDVTWLLTEIAASLNYPLSPQQQRQAEVVKSFLEHWGTQKWKSMLSLCTEDIISYSSALLPNGAGSPAWGKVALLAQASAFRRRYRRLRIEAQGIYWRPHGLAVRYKGYFVERGVGWDFFTGTELFEFASARICQIGVRMSYQQWHTPDNLPPVSFGSG